MATYLITGGAGFIGSHLADHLLGAGHAVRVLDDLSTGRAGNLADAVDLVVGDAANPATVGQAAAGCDGIFHLAAVASVQRSTEDWVGAHRANQTSTVVVLDVARQLGGVPVTYASSAAVYGDGEDLPLAETAPARPLTAYGADKLGSELHARVGWTVHRLPTAGLRFFNVFGPRQDPNSPYSGVISVFADRIGKGQAIQLHGDGRQTRDFVYVTDVVRHLAAAMATILERPRSLICNVCTGRAVAVADLAQALARVAGRPALIEHGPARAGDIRHSLGDPSLARHELGTSAVVGLEEGLAATLESLRRP